MSTPNVNVARFARIAEWWDFFCDFQTPCVEVTSGKGEVFPSPTSPLSLNFFRWTWHSCLAKIRNDDFSFFTYRSSEFLSPCVSIGDHLQSVYPSIRTSTSVPSRQAGMYRNGHRKVLCRRLVPHLFNGTKHRLRHFQSKYPMTIERASLDPP